MWHSRNISHPLSRASTNQFCCRKSLMLCSPGACPAIMQCSKGPQPQKLPTHTHTQMLHTSTPLPSATHMLTLQEWAHYACSAQRTTDNQGRIRWQRDSFPFHCAILAAACRACIALSVSSRWCELAPASSAHQRGNISSCRLGAKSGAEADPNSNNILYPACRQALQSGCSH